MDDRRRQKLIDDATLSAGLSGAGSGGVLGGMSAILSGKRRLWDIAKNALVGSTLSGTTAAGATRLGSELLGPPTDNDLSPFTERGGIGGAVGGSLVGGALGALAGSKLGMPKYMPAFAKRGLSAVGSALPVDNLIVDQIKKLGPLGGAAIGATAGGVGAGFLGADEGMQIDFIQNQLKEAEKRRLLQKATGQP